jgi:hypothetical protein
MGAIRYDLSENRIIITKGNHHREVSFREEPAQGDVKVLFNKNQVAGVSIPEFLSDVELSGAAAEEAFKSFLDRNSIPYLYIGQGPIGIEKSETLLGDLGSRRPDFLVNLPNLGYMFVDVKSRRKIGFPSAPEGYYYLTEEELSGLVSLHRSLLIAVWVAFIDRDSEGHSRFFLASVPTLDNFYRSLTKELGADSRVASTTVSTLRVPPELLTTADRDLSFRVGLQPFGSETIQEYANRYKALRRQIHGTIYEVIRDKRPVKTATIDECTRRLGFCTLQEIRLHLERLIETGEIEYEPRKPLRLVGE